MAIKSNRERLKRRLAAVPKAARKTIRKALEQGAYDIADTAQAWAPEDDGDLKRSIGYTFGEYKADNANVRGVSGGGGLKDKDLSVTVHAGDEKAFYAAWVEFGTKPHTIEPKRPGGLLNVYGRMITSVAHPGARAQPFFFPAYRANKRKVLSRVNRAIKAAAKEAVRTQ